MKTNYTRIKYGCYMSNISMSIVSSFIPLLFVAFHEMYNISYTYLGALVLINFVSQLSVDLIYSFFAKKLNIVLSVKMMPVIMIIGLILIALAPIIFKNNVYIGIVIGVIIISASSGIAEVLNSRVIAAISPLDKQDSEMSKLHFVFALGVVITVLVCTVFIQIFTYKYWQVLAGILTIVPIVNIILYLGQEFPYFKEDEEGEGAKLLLSWEFVLCVVCIFLGAASENTMSQWISGYIEKAIGVPKIWGDLFGVMMFSFFLGLGRFLYSKIGKNITYVLVFGSLGAFICYVLAAVVANPILAIISCVLTGLCVSMLWPGTIIAASPKFAIAGVSMFAFLAAGGDLGGSIAPQIMGVLTDNFINNSYCIEYALSNSIPIDMVAMRVALLSVAIFPLLSIISSSILHIIIKRQK